MEFSHIVSAGILFLLGCFVFFRYLNGLNFWQTILWEAFVLSVGMSALFGAIGFMGIGIARDFSDYFRVLASTVGMLALVYISWKTALGRKPLKSDMWIVLALGFLVFAFEVGLAGFMPSKYLPLFAIPALCIAGTVAMILNKLAFGLWLILGGLLLALAIFCHAFVANAGDATNTYHYLMAASLLCFGLAASKSMG